MDETTNVSRLTWDDLYVERTIQLISTDISDGHTIKTNISENDLFNMIIKLKLNNSESSILNFIFFNIFNIKNIKAISNDGDGYKVHVYCNDIHRPINAMPLKVEDRFAANEIHRIILLYNMENNDISCK